jgi:hypothetical protein
MIGGLIAALLILIFIIAREVAAALVRLLGPHSRIGGRRDRHSGDHRDDSHRGSHRGSHRSSQRDPRRTFLYIGEQLPVEVIRARLPDWREVSIESRPKYVDAVIASGMGLSDRRLFNIHAMLKCRLDSKELTDKVKFHTHMAIIAPDLIARTIAVDADTILPDGVWMIRANWGWGGKAAAVATTTEELRALYTRFVADNPLKVETRVIASEYIVDPMLYNGYKFHLRIYLLIVMCADGSRYLSMLRNGLIIPAHQKYIRGDWENAEIHDTHGRDNRGLGRFPRDLPDGEALLGAVTAALKRAIVPLLPRVNLYSEAKNGYEMLGADVMFESDGTLRIIEINDTPGLTWLAAHPEGDAAREEILDFLFGGAFGRVFGSDNTVPSHDSNDSSTNSSTESPLEIKLYP